MFLDDELYQIGKSVDLCSIASVDEVIGRMVKVVLRRLSDDRTSVIDVKGDDALFIATIQKVQKLWNIAEARLKKDGFDFLTEDSFITIIEDCLPSIADRLIPHLI